MKRTILYILLLGSTLLYAQEATQQTGSIQGTVVDSQSGQILEMVAVQLFTYSGNDSTMVGGAQSDMEGYFYFMKVKHTWSRYFFFYFCFHYNFTPKF